MSRGSRVVVRSHECGTTADADIYPSEAVYDLVENLTSDTALVRNATGEYATTVFARQAKAVVGAFVPGGAADDGGNRLYLQARGDRFGSVKRASRMRDRLAPGGASSFTASVVRAESDTHTDSFILLSDTDISTLYIWSYGRTVVALAPVPASSRHGSSRHGRSAARTSNGRRKKTRRRASLLPLPALTSVSSRRVHARRRRRFVSSCCVFRLVRRAFRPTVRSSRVSSGGGRSRSTRSTRSCRSRRASARTRSTAPRALRPPRTRQ